MSQFEEISRRNSGHKLAMPLSKPVGFDCTALRVRGAAVLYSFVSLFLSQGSISQL